MRFVICCIPFFVYDLALGDEVAVSASPTGSYKMDKVVRQSGHYTFRVFLGGNDDAWEAISDEINQRATQLGCLYEWFSARLVALDAPMERAARALSGFLLQLQEAGQLHYETGRTE